MIDTRVNEAFSKSESREMNLFTRRFSYCLKVEKITINFVKMPPKLTNEQIMGMS